MRQRRSRFARLWKTHRGMTRLEAELAPDAGARVHAALERISSAMLRSDRRLPHEERRNADQRGADALTEAVSESGGLMRVACCRPDDNSGSRTATRASDTDRSDQSRDRQTAHTGHTRAGAASHQDHHKASSRSLASSVDEADRATSQALRRHDHRMALASSVDEADRAASHSAASECDDCCAAVRQHEDRSHGDVPLLRISASLEAVRGQVDEMGITDTGEELALETLRRLACDASILPAFMDYKGDASDSGRAKRRIPKRLRQQLIMRDGGCVWPGCDAPASRTQGHHRVHWAEGGPTTLDNLSSLCSPHHILVHEGQYRIEPDGQRGWLVYRPDESILTCTHDVDGVRVEMKRRAGASPTGTHPSIATLVRQQLALRESWYGLGSGSAMH